ncbi:MAG: hypothetical protein Q8Q41_03410 [bacterium]|nr:hypothetical protein [bacterium]
MEKAVIVIMFVVLLGVALYALPFFVTAPTGVSRALGVGVIAVGTDSGISFTPASVHAPRNPDITVIDSQPEEGLLFAGSTGGLLVSRDGGKNWYQWSDLEKQVDDGTVIYDLARNPSRPREVYVAAFRRNEGVIYRTDNNFFTLTKVWDAQEKAPYALAVDGAHLYFGLSDGRVMRYRFTDGKFEGLSALGSPVVDIDVRGNGATLYAATKSRGIFASFDGGRTFAQLKGDLSSYPGALKMTAVAPDASAANRVYAASLSGLLRSDDAGDSWVVISSVITPGSPVSALEVRSDGRIFAASGEKLYISDDRGTTWRIATPLPNGRTLSAIKVFNDGTIVVGTAAE